MSVRIRLRYIQRMTADKLLVAERKSLPAASGAFEVIDVVDEARIGQIRGRLDVPVPMQVQWNGWEYGSEIAELRRLYEKGKVSQWNATTDVSWDQPVSKDEWIGDPQASLMAIVTQMMGLPEKEQKAAMFDEVAWLFSNLLHGEQGALQICGQLTNLCGTTDEKFYAASQVADEARHTEVFARLLSDKFGVIYPVSPVVKTLLDELLSVEGYYMKTLGMQTLFEGFAMGLMDYMRVAISNPLVKDVLRRVELDEARHAAFGVLTMRRVMREVSDDERQRMAEWTLKVMEALNASQNLAMLREIGPKYGLDAEATQMGMLMQPNWAELNSIVFMHTVVPNLVRLGLISEENRERWQQLGMLSDIRKAKQGPTEPDLS